MLLNGNITGDAYREIPAFLRTIIISNHAERAVCCAVAVSLLAFAERVAADEYRISIDAKLTQMTVTARFSAPVMNVSARSNDAKRYLLEARDCDTGRELTARGRRLQLGAAGIRCLHYRVDLMAAAKIDRRQPTRVFNTVVVSPTLWMWRPRLSGNDDIIVRFDVEEGTQVFVPWDVIDARTNTYRLAASPESGSAIAVFGEFATGSTRVAGAKLNVVFLNPSDGVDTTPLLDWLRDTAETVALAYGRFPNPGVSIVVVHVGENRWGGDSPVTFGQVVRDGGETIELLIDDHRPIADFYGNWTATHEFSHLMLPYLQRSQRWISEGFAQYYQNVLLARADHYTESEAWQNIYDGLQRGLQSAPGLSPNSAAAGRARDTRMKVYWSGASLALMADAELRRRSKGADSLDTVLSRFQQCCLPSARTWSGPELFQRLDTLLEEPLFMDLYRRYANRSGFPDASPLLERMGITGDGDQVRLQDDAELAWIRRAISTGNLEVPLEGKTATKIY